MPCKTEKLLICDFYILTCQVFGYICFIVAGAAILFSQSLHPNIWRTFFVFWHRTYSIVQTPQFASRNGNRMASWQPVRQTPDSAAGSAARAIAICILRKDQHHRRAASVQVPLADPWNSGSVIWLGGPISLFCTHLPLISADASLGRL